MAISKQIVTKKIDINKNRISGQSDKKENMDIYIYETRKRFSIMEKKKNRYIHINMIILAL